MLRRHSVEGVSVVEVAAGFGVSRPTVYQAQAAFQQAGLSGLLPRHRGPKEGHKLSCRSYRICANLAICRARPDNRRLCPVRSGRVRHHGSSPQFGAGAGEQKKTAQSGIRSAIPEGTVEAYEGLRRQVVQPDGGGEDLEEPPRSYPLWPGSVGPDRVLAFTRTYIRSAQAISRTKRQSSTRWAPNSCAWWPV